MIDDLGDEDVGVGAGTGGYALMGNPNIPDRLQSFYDKSDAGRAGRRATPLPPVRT